MTLLLKNYRDVGNPKALDRQRMVSFYFRWFGNLDWINIYVLFVVNFSRIDFFLSFFIFIIVKSFFSLKRVESGVALLNKALTMNHMGAICMYGIMLLCRGDNSNEKEGLYLLDVVKKSTQLEECRTRVKSFISTMWVENHSLKYEELKIYCLKTCKKT